MPKLLGRTLSISFIAPVLDPFAHKVSSDSSLIFGNLVAKDKVMVF